MKTQYKNLGKVRPTVEGNWNKELSYSLLSIVYDEESNKSYISSKEVPVGISLLNREYWTPFANTRVDSDSIILLSNQRKGVINSFTLQEAIDSIHPADRRVGVFISFYEKPISKVDNYRWNLYQFNSNDVRHFNDVTSWISIYYNKNKFVGFYNNEDDLFNLQINPEIGDYAYVGNTLADAVIYICRNRFTWNRTNEKAKEYVSVIVQGNVTIGSNGNWFNNGIDTGIQSKGDKGDKPLLKFNTSTGDIDFSYDNINWIPLVNKEEITGAAATISVGNVISLPSGNKATVINVGNKYNAIFDFYIPEGHIGVQGPKGDTGKGLTVKGFVSTSTELPNTNNVLGDGYLVGTTIPYNLYIYNGTTWINIGPVNQIEGGNIDGGNANTKYGGNKIIDCGRATNV